ncbi:Type IV pilus biogenesis protein PilQ [Olavius algarvensis Delta 1 endosymbiont]|nr:Type IV pilus biogenesis protein PilQ [Olavius algarvensis Delta 1 endosymbiont]
MKLPPRIVYDIYKIKSPFKGEQRIAVKADQVKKIRHFGHPDKIRIVLETDKAYLSKHSARPVENGVLIYVGQAPPPGKDMPKTVKSRAAKPMQASTTAKPAWLNRIDFNSEDLGKSTLFIGTTRPVKYDMIRVDNKRLNLKLMGTNLPEYRKQALITTRFQSAVDRITPTFRPTSKDTVIDIELREGVPYSVKQTGDVIRVNFAASKIPPKPYEDAKLPAWKQTQGRSAAAGSNAPVADATPATTASAVKPKLVAAHGQPATTTTGTAAAATTAPPAKTADKAAAPKEAQKATPSPRPARTSDVVIYTETDPDRFDYERQMRLDPYSGEERSLDVYGETIVKKYTGEPIALDFYETDIKNVFRILKEISGKNFAVDKGVTGRVTLALEQPVPWDQVLDLVLKMNQLGRKMEGGIIRVATLSTLAAEELARRKKLGEAQLAKKQEDFVTAFIRVNYANAVTINDQHVAELLTPKESRMDEVGGESSVDDRLNMIVVTDVPSVIKRVKEIVQRLDQVTPPRCSSKPASSKSIPALPRTLALIGERSVPDPSISGVRRWLCADRPTIYPPRLVPVETSASIFRN